MIRSIIAASVSILALGTAASQVQAADVLDPAACAVAALIQGGGMLGSNAVKFPSGSAQDSIPFTSGFGEAAGAYFCGDWGVQIDGAAYGSWGNDPRKSVSLTSGQGHVGGDLIWRDPSQAAFGLSASRIFQSYSAPYPGGQNNPVSDSSGMWRLGAFGEVYANDMLTLGGGAYYLNGQTIWFGVYNQHGFEGDLFAKIYASDNLALTLRGDLMRLDIARSTPGRFSGAAVSADAEFLVPDSALSVFVGGRYASRTYDEDGGFNFAVTDLQGFAGVKFALGGPAPSSLRDRDRHGTVDNTSVFQEKLIGLESEVPFD